MPLAPKPPRSAKGALLTYALKPPRTPFTLLSRLSFVFVAGSALHVPWQTAAIIAGFILAAYLTALATCRHGKQPKG
jgi:hypothetical protein